MARFDCALITVALKRFHIRTPTHFRVWTTTSINLRMRTSTSTSTYHVASGKFVLEEDFHKTAFCTRDGVTMWVAIPFGV
jgi:hypothetical protein